MPLRTVIKSCTRPDIASLAARKFRCCFVIIFIPFCKCVYANDKWPVNQEKKKWAHFWGYHANEIISVCCPLRTVFFFFFFGRVPFWLVMKGQHLYFFSFFELILETKWLVIFRPFPTFPVAATTITFDVGLPIHLHVVVAPCVND